MGFGAYPDVVVEIEPPDLTSAADDVSPPSERC